MPPIAGLQEARELAFCKIGRNLANFQRMEAMLKFVITNSRFSSAIPKAKEGFRRHEMNIRTRTFGELVERFPDALKENPDEPLYDAESPWVAFAISCSALSPDVLKELRKQLRVIVRDRNQLVHHMLANVEQGSVEAWVDLGEELDAQRERMLQVFERVRFVASTVQDMRNILADNAALVAETLLIEMSKKGHPTDLE